MNRIIKILRSPVKKKVVRFFCENPQSVDSVRGISAWIGAKPQTVKKVLEELVEAGILVAHRGSSTTGYAYTQDRQIISHIESAFGGKKLTGNK